MFKVVGTCSLCGGPVVIPKVWNGVIPPIPTCQGCGATAAQHGEVIPMISKQMKQSWSTNTGN